jgi:long-subunit fatty acid transport protein
MKTKISMAIVALGTIGTTAANAGGIDRTGQSLAPLFEQGNYMEFSLGSVSPKVSGTVSGASTDGNIAPADTFLGGAFKFDLSDKLSVAGIIEEPFGAELGYPATATSVLGGTNGTIDTSAAMTAAVRYKTGDRWSVLGGVRAVDLDAELTQYAGGTMVYDLDAEGEYQLGYTVGLAYEIPEMALRAALTYNSQIKTDLQMQQQIGGSFVSETSSVTLPDSVNLELQSGIAPKTLAFANFRYVDWSKFSVESAAYTGAFAAPILAYEDATLTSTLGAAHVLNENWTVLGAVTHEAGKSPALNLLTPVDGFNALTIGAIYTKGAMRIQGSLTNAWFGDVSGTTSNGAFTGSFADSSAVSASLKMSISF